MTERRKRGLAVLMPALVCVVSILGITVFWRYEYRRSAFEHVSKFCEIMVEDYPETEKQVFSALKQYHALAERERQGNQFLEQYGYRKDEFGEGILWKFLIPSMGVMLLVTLGFWFVAGYLNKCNRRRIAELTNYLEQVNVGASGTVLQTKEDEFSSLQDEMYKTVTSLYQTREAAVRAKENFADNLANIAHQLKTPITAAFLSLQLMIC